MDEILNNWVVNENVSNIEILNFSIKQKINELSIPLKGYETFVNWDLINPSYNFFYDFEGNEIEIKERLEKSKLNECEFLIIDIGYNNQMIKVSTSFFIEKWEDFVASNGFTGIFIFSEEGDFFMEFTDDSSYQLYSNFII